MLFSINHHLCEKSKSGAKGLLKTIETIKATGKNEIVFKLSGGSADFPFLLGDYHLSICPAGTSGQEWEKGRAHFDEVETLSIVDTSARTNALKTVQINYMDRIELKTVHLMKKMPGINVTATTGTAHYTIPMLVDKKPYNENNVRMALKLAVDREELLRQILRGYGALGNDHPIAPVNQYYAKDLEQRNYDLEKAKFHIKKAGLLDHVFCPGGLQLQFSRYR